MALITTAGDSAADAYGTLADFQAYCQKIGFDLSSFTATDDGDQEVANRLGVIYLDRAYAGLYIGFASNKDQALRWPRRSFRDDAYYSNPKQYSTTGFQYLTDGSGFIIEDDEIPIKLQNAQFEAAILSLGGVNLNPTIERGSLVASESVQAGPIKSTTAYRNNASAPVRSRFLAIEGLLWDYVDGQPSSPFGGGVVERG